MIYAYTPSIKGTNIKITRPVANIKGSFVDFDRAMIAEILNQFRLDYIKLGFKVQAKNTLGAQTEFAGRKEVGFSFKLEWKKEKLSMENFENDLLLQPLASILNLYGRVNISGSIEEIGTSGYKISGRIEKGG